LASAIKNLKILDYNQLHTSLELVNTQIRTKYINYVIYKQQISMNDNKFAYHDFEVCTFITKLINTNNHDTYHFILNVDGTYFVLNAINPQTLALMIDENKNNRYLFLSFNYGADAIGSGHQAVIMIDIIEKHVYFIDPNGHSSYFDKIFGIKLSFQIEQLVRQYFENFNSFFGHNYTYQFIHKWNPNHMCINKIFNENYEMGSGHCVILSIILSHIISVTKCLPIEGYKLLKSVSDDELLFIAKEYTVRLYKIIQIQQNTLNN
jgi:hypothetical protein